MPEQINHLTPDPSSPAQSPSGSINVDQIVQPQPPLPEDQNPIDPNPSSSAGGYARPVELAAWSAPTRMYDPKSPSWFLGLFTIGLVATVILAVLKEFWLILVVAAAIFVYYALARVEPVAVEHRILTTGIETGGRIYGWKDLQSFWITSASSIPMLRIDTKLLFPHVLELLLPEDADTEDLSDLLLQYLPEEEKPSSQAGNVADQAILSVFNIMPFRDRLLGWWQKRFDTQSPQS